MKDKIISIQLLRAFACLFVLQVHVLKYIPFVNIPFYGSIGVDLFFVISGYIIASAIDKLPEQGTSKQFLINRFSRVAPYYYLLTLLAVLTMFFYFHSLRHIGLPKLLPSFLFFPQRNDPVLFLGWTLDHEMFFYLTVGLSLLFVPKNKSVFIGFIFFGVVLFSNFLPHLENETINYFESFLCAAINYTFLLGFFSYHLKDKILHFFKPAPITLLAIILFITVPVIGNEILPENDITTPYRRQLVFLFHTNFALSRFIIWGIPSMLLFLCFLANEERLQKHRNSLLVKIGNASFSIYLIQGVVLFFYTRTSLSKNLFFAYCFCIALVALALKMVWVENYVGKKIKGLLTNLSTIKNGTRYKQSYLGRSRELHEPSISSEGKN
jgi:exopolysaccharide production protein ExoZ